MDASVPTTLLIYWVRDRGLLTVEDAIRRLTSDTAHDFPNGAGRFTHTPAVTTRRS